MTYAEFLKSQGATDADIAVLDTPIAQRAFAAQEARAAEALRLKEEADTKLADYNDWYTNKAAPSYKKMEQDYLVAKGNEARAAAVLLQSQDEGLKAVAESMGYKADGSPAGGGTGAPGGGTRTEPAIDPSKYLTRAEAEEGYARVGASLAELQDMVLEHAQLFPDKRLNVAELRKRAVENKTNVYAQWMKEFNVVAAREAAVKAAQDAHDKKIADETRKAVESEMASRYANPDTRPLSSSLNIFTPRKSDPLRAKQPWESDANELRRDRITRATQHAIAEQTGTRTN